ncbi:IucA/IucC family protein [Streptomyces kaniharaensis]|uniref:IucA/IucC family protein n=1 Tax=Streptomyces kaniharaensis TaxID=212423 RepID=UPI002DDDA18A|nr:IucA/IucC family protein [Streptomyces kaniharaensis]
MTERDELTLRVLGALLREDVLGLRTASVPVERADGRWLRLELSGTAVLLPVADEGFQCEHTARLPLLEVDGARVTGLDEMIGSLRALAAPEDRAGYDAFAEECRQTLATMRLHAGARDGVHAELAARYGADPADWTGLRGSLAEDTLAAYHDHPVYPTARGRRGLDDENLRRYAPEFHPSFPLRWLAVPREALTTHGDAPLPAWWPTPRQLGLPDPTGHRLAIPVHPLSIGEGLEEALAATALGGRAVLAERPYLTVVPTLSMRTVAVVETPLHHLKLPLATATLGRRNRRTIKPGVLPDGAAGQRLLEAVIAREPRFAHSVLLADEQWYAETGHELLAVLLRRYPATLQDALTVPLAALLAAAPGGRLVIDHLADRFFRGDVLALYDSLLAVLLDWHTTLFGYGIALESHQQNTSLVLDLPHGRTRLRLLLKDNDGPRINTVRSALLDVKPDDFTDPRICGTDDRPLTDLFTTITGHLCTAAVAFGLAAHGRASLTGLLRLLRDRLDEAIGRLGADGEPMRAALLDAERLPVKAMVTAGTLLSKERSGAADVNKYYTSGPNYLLRAGVRR